MTWLPNRLRWSGKWPTGSSTNGISMCRLPGVCPASGIGGRDAHREGKTLTATLPACTAALAGLPVHIVTVNDYLATRDADLMGPIYRALGLSVGVIVHGLTPEARRQSYACDVTYCTNKELVFDYLKDRLAVGRQSNGIQRRLRQVASPDRCNGLLLRGLYYAIVDEADSVLVDEARTPLIIAGRGNDAGERQVYEQSLAVARQLRLGREARLDVRSRHVTLTEAGSVRATELTQGWAGCGVDGADVNTSSSRRCRPCTCSNRTSITSFTMPRCRLSMSIRGGSWPIGPGSAACIR